MKRTLRVFYCLMTLALILASAPIAALADQDSPLVIDAQVLGTVDIVEEESPYSFFVQATSWAGPPYRYVITVGNFSPWPMTALRVLDRYLPSDPEQAEIDREWLFPPLEAGKVTNWLIELPESASIDGCHQLEISLADGVGTILMDCSRPSATTIWSIPLDDKMTAYLSKPPLTQSAPSGSSKVGLHVTRNSSSNIMDFVKNASPAVIVAVGDLGWLADVKRESPDTVTVGRLQESGQTFEGDPVERAREFVSANAIFYKANPGVDYWLGWNEPVIDEIGQMDWYAAFEAERVRAMAALGYKTAIGNFSAGTPEADEFAAFLPAVAVAKAYGGILALHEYSAPTLRDGVGAGIPGLEGNGDRGALTLRYRFWYDHYLQANDLVLPLVITEAGIDGGVLPPEADLSGWRDLNKSAPEDDQSIKEYLAQLSWYDDELRRDPYVLGFAIFNAGDSDGRWASFDVTGILPQLSDLVQSKQQ